MKFLIILLLSAFLTLSDGHYTKKCTITKTQTVKTGHTSIAYITETVTLTQGSGTFTTTIYDSVRTLTIKKPESIKTVLTTLTEKVTSRVAVSVTTTTVTNLDSTASYVSTLTQYTASVITTVLLETSDSQNNFKIWTGLHLTLLLIGSLIFFI